MTSTQRLSSLTNRALSANPIVYLIALIAALVLVLTLTGCDPAANRPAPVSGPCMSTEYLVDVIGEVDDPDTGAADAGAQFNVRVSAVSDTEGHPGIVVSENASGGADQLVAADIVAGNAYETTRSSTWNATLCVPADRPVRAIVQLTIERPAPAALVGHDLRCRLLNGGVVLSEITNRVGDQGSTGVACELNYVPPAAQ